MLGSSREGTPGVGHCDLTSLAMPEGFTDNNPIYEGAGIMHNDSCKLDKHHTQYVHFY